MRINLIKQFTIYFILSVLLNGQVCWGARTRDDFKTQNLAPVIQVNSDGLKSYFTNDISSEEFKAVSENSFVKLTKQIKEDKELFGLFNKLNSLGQLNERETILSLLVMTNGVKMPVVRLIGGSSGNFYHKLKKYGIKGNFFKQVNARDIFIRSGLAESRQDDTLYLEMDNLPYGLSKQLMKALGSKLLVKHKLYDTGQLGRFEGENYKFKNRPNEDVEVIVEYGHVTGIKFLSDNTYADKFARIYDKKGQLIDSTRRLGVKIKDLKNNTVVLELNKTGAISIAEQTGARLKWGKYYTHYDGRKFDLEGKQVKLTIENGVVVRAILVEQNIELALNVVYESDTHLPVYCSVSRLTKERMEGFDQHYVISRLSGSGTLEAGGKTWCTLSEYPNFRVKYFINQGWVRDIEVYDQENNLKRQKTIHLVYDKQGKIIDFFRRITLESIAKLNDHTIDYTLYRDTLFIANEKEEHIPGPNGRISMSKIIPQNAEYPIEGRLVIKNGIIISFECGLAATDNFYYVLDADTKKVLFYFNDMGKDTFNQLDNVVIIKKVTRATDAGVLKLGAGSVYVKFPQWAVGSWVMFEVRKGKRLTKINFLKSKDYSDMLKNVKGDAVLYRKKTAKGRWQLSCSDKNLPEEIKTYAQSAKIEAKKHAEKFKSKRQKQSDFAQIKQIESAFMKSVALIFDKAGQKSMYILYQMAKNKGFTLDDEPDVINLISLLRFASESLISKDSEISRLKTALFPKLSFLNKAKLILNENEVEIFVQMYGQIRQIYVEYKQGGYGRAEALRKTEDVLEAWRERFAAYNDAVIEDKVFISFLAKRLVGMFFQSKKASFDQVQNKLKGMDIVMLDLNTPEFQSSRENLEKVKKLNDELLAMGWEIRFMKSNAYYKSKKQGVQYISVEKLIRIHKFLKENELDFSVLQKGGFKKFNKKTQEQFEKEFGFKLNELLYQSIISNIRMIGQNEQKIPVGVFDKWFFGLKGLKAQIVQSKKDEVLENLNLVFDKNFQKDQASLLKNPFKELPGFLSADKYIEQAI